MTQSRKPLTAKEYAAFNSELTRKLKESLDLNRPHGLRLLEDASKHASGCFKLTIMLSAGAFTLVPTFIKAFNIQGIKANLLFSGLTCFALSLAIGLIAYLFIYLASFFSARLWVSSSNADLNEIMLTHYDEKDVVTPRELKRRFKKEQKDELKRARYAGISQIIAVLLYLASVMLMFAGAYQSLSALSGSVFSYEKHQTPVEAHQSGPDENA